MMQVIEDNDENEPIARPFTERRAPIVKTKVRRTWRSWVKDLLLAAGIVTATLSMFGYVIGPVLGKRITDDATVMIQAQEARVIASEKILSEHSAEIKAITDSVAVINRRSAGSVYIQCQMFDMLAPRAPRPEICRDVPRFRP